MRENQDTNTTKAPSTITERIIIIGTIILAIAIGYEQGAKHATQAFTLATRTAEAQQRETQAETTAPAAKIVEVRRAN